MENTKILALLLGLAMVMGVTPVFAADSGTTPVSVTLGDAVSIIVTGSGEFTGVSADNVLSDAMPIKINSTSNVAVDVSTQAPTWDKVGSGNMPLSALKWGGSQTAMTSSPVKAIDNLAAGLPGEGSAQNVNLYLQVPFGSTNDVYNTTVTWIATKHA
jgi:hypothetical protein